MRPIHISLSPNLSFPEVWSSFKILLMGVAGGEAEKMSVKLKEMLGCYFPPLMFNSGRSALWAVIKALELKEGDEVAVAAFTCVATINSIRWAGAKPIFIDILEDTLTIDPSDLADKLNSKTKAVLVQHTFGKPANMTEITRICRRKKIFVIEDCAHVLGGYIQNLALGRWGDVAIFSFGRDKALSSVFGGAAISDNPKIYERLVKIWNDLELPKKSWIRQQLLHPIITWKSLMLYNLGIGKIILKISQQLGLLSLAVYKEERSGKKPENFPTKYPDELACLGLAQLERLPHMNKRRSELSAIYDRVLAKSFAKDSILLRYPVKVEHLDKILDLAKKENWIWGDWYRQVITPVRDPHMFGYKKGSCPIAEKAAGHIVNLPTCFYISDAKAREMAGKLSEWLK